MPATQEPEREFMAAISIVDALGKKLVQESSSFLARSGFHITHNDQSLVPVSMAAT